MTVRSGRALGPWSVGLIAGTLACAAGENQDVASGPSGSVDAASGTAGDSASGRGGAAAEPGGGAGSRGGSTEAGGTFAAGGAFGSGGTFGSAGMFGSAGTFGSAGASGQTSGGGAGGGNGGASGAAGSASGGKPGSSCASLKLTPSGATASCMERADLGPQLAIDGDTTTTRWASEQMNDAAWLLIDLGEVATVNRVTIAWEAAYAASYEVQLATSPAGPFQDLFADPSGNGGTDDVTAFTPAAGRYVRMQGVTRKTMYGYSIWEMTVYGDEDETCE